QPQLELGLGLADADHDRAARSHAFLAEPPAAVGNREGHRRARVGGLYLTYARRGAAILAVGPSNRHGQTRKRSPQAAAEHERPFAQLTHLHSDAFTSELSIIGAAFGQYSGRRA